MNPAVPCGRHRRYRRRVLFVSCSCLAVAVGLDLKRITGFSRRRTERKNGTEERKRTRSPVVEAEQADDVDEGEGKALHVVLGHLKDDTDTAVVARGRGHTPGPRMLGFGRFGAGCDLRWGIMAWAGATWVGYSNQSSPRCLQRLPCSLQRPLVGGLPAEELLGLPELQHLRTSLAQSCVLNRKATRADGAVNMLTALLGQRPIMVPFRGTGGCQIFCV